MKFVLKIRSFRLRDDEDGERLIRNFDHVFRRIRRRKKRVFGDGYCSILGKACDRI